MRFLKQSTSVDLPIGPFLDSTDGVTAETALTITQPDIRLKKNGGAWAQKAAAQTLSHEENGWYEVTLDATDTDTCGQLMLAVAESGALPVWCEFHVLEEAIYDALFAASANAFQGAAGSTKVTGVVLTDTVTTYTGNTPQTGDSFARIGATGSGLTSLASQASVDDIPTVSEFNARTLVAASYATAANQTTIVTHLTDIKGAGWTTTDTLEAIRDRGDAAWITATGFSTHSAADVWASATRTLTAATNISGPIADQVWDEAIAGHLSAGSTGEALGAAGSAGDPWTTALPGAYGAGTAGFIIGTNVNATVSSRASQASVDDLPTNAELATALGTADDAVLAAIAALNNLSQANIRTAIGLATANLDTQLDALPTNAELATALGTADDAVLAAIAALNNLSQANIRTAVGLASANLDTQLDALPTNAELATALGTADDAVLAQVALVLADTAQIKADLPSRITKNTALANFPFFMVDATDGFTAETGLAITATRSIDGAAFGVCANAATEIASGWYKINLAAADLNGDTIILRFTGTGARDRFITVVTQP